MGTSQEAMDKVRGWLTGRIPDGWFEDAPEVVIDREEITVVGRIRAPASPDKASATERAAAVAGRISEFRERTREQRIDIAADLEHRSRRKVAWGVRCGDTTQMFTTLSVPVMTRLRQPERQVLDTLVDAGVARSRSDALAWCVKLVGRNTDAWLAELREALRHVEQARAGGPDVGS